MLDAAGLDDRLLPTSPKSKTRTSTRITSAVPTRRRRGPEAAICDLIISPFLLLLCTLVAWTRRDGALPRAVVMQGAASREAVSKRASAVASDTVSGSDAARRQAAWAGAP